MRPSEGQFGVKIDFVRGQSDPVQVFAAMTDLLSGFKQLDREFADALAKGAIVTTVIEDVEAASITAWIRSALSNVDDEAIKSMDLKKAFGVYVVKAKHLVIDFIDEREEQASAARRETLKEDLQILAQEAGGGSFLAPVIQLENLEDPMNTLQGAKARLTHGESVTVQSAGFPDRKIDLDARAPVKLAVVRTEETSKQDGGISEMLLLIRKPDLIGKSKWDFKHGKQSVSAQIEDQDWMRRFHRGQEGSMIPGTEMRARVRLSYERGTGGSINDVEYVIEKVIGIEPPRMSVQERLFDDD